MYIVLIYCTKLLNWNVDMYFLLFATKVAKEHGGCWMDYFGGIRQRIGGQHQSVLVIKWRDLFVTFGISYWNSLEFMTFDKLGICRYLNNDDFFIFLKQRNQLVTFCSIHHLVVERKWWILTNTHQDCLMQFINSFCILYLFLRWSNIIWQG